MPNDRKLLRHVLLLTALAFVGGTLGYLRIEEGWTVLDAFYMTVITLTTIGFGEVLALSPAGQLFTIVLVLFGLGAAATLGTQLAGMLADGSFGLYWRNRRMERKLSRLHDHIIVCGYGRIGHAICEELAGMGAVCVVVESDPDKQAEARSAGLAVLPGNATSDAALLNAGIGRAKAVVAALSHDTDNVFIALSARELNPGVAIIARAEDDRLEPRLRKAGVNRVVYPAKLGGGRIARLVGQEIGLEEAESRKQRAVDVLGYDLRFHRHVGSGPRTLHEIELETGALRTLALVRADGERVEDPPHDILVQPQEALALLVDTTAAESRAQTWRRTFRPTHEAEESLQPQP